MVAHMLSDQELIKVVRDETDLCFTPDGECDLHKLITACPTLDAIWNEVLRLYNASTAVRKASEDCVIGGKNIHKGDQIFGPVRNWQLDKQYFGEKADQFNASRWTETKGLTRSRGFTPFGGGHTYCPGRYFAQREIYSYIAVLLQNFRLNVTDSSGTPIMNPKVPPVETNLPAPAAMRPVYDILITLTKRRDQA
jgi:cytochrome P450